VILHANHWRLTLPELQALRQRLQRQGLTLIGVECRNTETLVAAAAVGSPPAQEQISRPQRRQ